VTVPVLSTDSIIEQLDALLDRAGLAPGEFVDWRYWDKRSSAEMSALGTAWSQGIERLAPKGSRYVVHARQAMEGSGVDSGVMADLAGILNALREDYRSGFSQSVEELVHADVFGDFLEMAQELLDKKYQDPAAVITGSVLEEHLRKLCDLNGVPVLDASGKPFKADFLNAELVKAGVYNKLEQKQVTAWLDLRNKAAHGHYQEYDATQVALMLEGVRGFLVKHPA
jgi:hypothetical protein